MDPTPASTENTASIKLIGMAEKAATTEPKVLEPRAEGKVWHRLEMLPLPLLQEDLGKSRMPLREALIESICRRRLKALLLLLQEGPSKGECEPKWAL